MPTPAQQLQSIATFADLVRYLEDELDWPLHDYGFDELTFEYQPAELGLKEADAAKVKAIHQLRPLQHGQPWGIFFVEFERKKLPVVLLRRILSHLVVKKRAAANRADAAAWDAADLLFIAAYGDDGPTRAAAAPREIAFAHFHQEAGDLPTLRVLGWDGADTPLKLEHVAATLRARLQWPDDPQDQATWRSQWSSIFRHRPGHVITTADALAEALAGLARRIRYAALTLLDLEAENGALRSLHKAFQTALIHDLNEADFADTYAQTITYGLLTAAINRTDRAGGRADTTLYTNMLPEVVPVTNPFLREMLQAFLSSGGQRSGINFDELGIQDVVELLRGEDTDLPAILRDFGNKTQGEDPVIHFYEHFLTAYDKALKVKRGVFYTPQPVVSYIVRSVDELLRSEFGLEDGLASTVTWGEMAQRTPGLTIPKDTAADSPFVVVLDPATGTATFLVEVIDVIHRTLEAKWRRQGLSAAQRQAAWNEYVPRRLLPRLYGYELMMAPYAIAHMKIGLKLHETGYRFGSEERVRVYLTNALEPSDDDAQMVLAGIQPALAHEAQAVNAIKRQQRFTIIIGNPPYSYMSANLTDVSKSLVEAFHYVDGQRIVERGALVFERALQDDYVKFFGLTLGMIEKSGIGFISMISNSAYLNSPHHRGMRSSIKQRFSRLLTLDLHGDIKKGSIDDQNVFDIRTGVAIALIERNPERVGFECAVSELTGTRSHKESALNSSTMLDDCRTFFKPKHPMYLFNPTTGDSKEYGAYTSVADIFPLTSVGIKTNRDHLVIGYNDIEIDQRIRILIDPNRTTDDVKEELAIEDNAQWTVSDGRRECRASYSPSNFLFLDYRPFDTRRIYYHSSIVFNPRPAVMTHLLQPGNRALLTNRRIRTDSHAHFFVSGRLCMAELISSADNCNVYPLWITEQSLLRETSRRPNLNPVFLRNLSNSLDLPITGFYELPTSVTPEDIFHYIYAIFHSPTYRTRYAEFLKIDFPRIPLTASRDLFRGLARLGGALVALHLVEFALEDEAGAPTAWPRYPRLAHFTGGDRTVDRFPGPDKAWAAGRVAINASSGFEGVPEAVWNFHIGGYQVCHKWLKDRKGRALSDEDVQHYAKIVTALHETMRLMGEIDAVIDEHGGWPGAFV